MTAPDPSPAHAAATAIADTLAQPPGPGAHRPRLAQSLSRGAVGIALLHIERAHAGVGSWHTAHTWLRAAAETAISVATDAGLYVGAPALAFTLHAARADGTPRYRSALARVDTRVTALTHRRVDLAQARIDSGELATFAEYDLVRGLTGIGVHLLQHAPGCGALERVLTYLVRLTEPVRIDGESLPGWWVSHGPHRARSDDFPGGHGNNGVAHGVAGVLAVLALGLRRGVRVDGHSDAIARVCAWLDTWRQDTNSGPWWPQWIAHSDLRAGRPHQHRPGRASWCYGTPGLARAQQLAALATGDTPRQRLAEHALARCLTDPAQLDTITATGLCHGWAGLYQTARRAARDALTPEISATLPHLADLLTRHARPRQSADTGFLEGDAGLALALHTAGTDIAPVSGWDACLLLA